MGNWKEVIEVFLSVLVGMGGLELVKYFSTRSSTRKKAKAEADAASIASASTAFDNIVKMNEFLSKQVEMQTEQIAKLMEENQKLTKENAEMELREFKYHCEVRGCANRVPPNDY